MASWGELEAVLRCLWALLGHSWGALGLILGHLGRLGAILGWLGGQKSLFFLRFFNVFCNITFLNQDGHLDGFGGLLGASSVRLCCTQ